MVYKVTKENIAKRLNFDSKTNFRDKNIQKQTISSLKKILFQYSLMYLDFSFNEEFLFLRFGDALKAQEALIAGDESGVKGGLVGLSLEKVSGEEELNYWRHLLACWSDCRMMKSRHRIVGNRYKPVDSKKKLVDKIEIFNDELEKKHIQLY